MEHSDHSAEGKSLNRLAREKSPYLLQHASNPVDWYPWGDEAFARARAEDKPVFLSIGYSTCHWCHVMERESFEDPEVAGLMNETFINIKVDREERPDLDGVYMTAARMLGTRGGWPLTIIMTPDQRPFYAATYLPKHSIMGRVGMMDLAPRIRDLWRDQRETAEKVAGQVVTELNRPPVECAGDTPGESTLDLAHDQLQSQHDPVHGGFSEAPKFPTPHQLSFLLRYAHRTGSTTARAMVERTLQAMRRGGIYDHLGFGFHRYSTDREWLTPHFEKMLYDQAQLISVYTDAYQLTGRAEYERTARETIAYVLRDLASPEGAFFSAEDADSEGVEGKFYVWTEAEVRAVLSGDDAARAARVFNVRREGNFQDEATGRSTGRNILHRKQMEGDLDAPDPEVERVREQLLAARGRRVRPHRDDKVLTDWNGLMIGALAQAARAFAAPEYAEAGARAARFIRERMRDREGRLLHRWRDGAAAIRGFLDDYAFLAWGLLELYEATFVEAYLAEALELGREMVRRFRDETLGGLYLSAGDSAPTIARPLDAYDGALPSGNSVAALVFFRLSRITADPELERAGEGVLRSFFCQVGKAPAAFTALLAALDFALGPTTEVVIAGGRGAPDTAALIDALGRTYGPNRVAVLRPDRGPETIAEIAPYTGGLVPIGGRATAYVCRNYQCQLPTTEPAHMIELLSSS